jgi:DNA-directed RNA polymerase specialized sigma24 family protein
MTDEHKAYDGHFPTTRWTQIERAAHDDSGGRPVLGQLLMLYMPAMRAHLVLWKRLPPDQADDLLQGFVEKKILERHLLAHADRARGSRFRSFLLTALDNYVANEIDRQRAHKRSAGRPVEDIDDHPEAATTAAPSDAFDIEWARQVIQESLRRMQLECSTHGRRDYWELFQGRVLAPIHGDEPVAYEQLVAKFGYESPAQASNALVNAKRMFQRILRAVVGEYSGEEGEENVELEELLKVLSGAPPR